MSDWLVVEGVSKQYGSLTALRNVSLKIAPGEVVGLAGRNGAGVSTLINILAGLQSADSGTILFGEDKISATNSPQKLGIGIIHQTPQLAEQLDVTTNMFLGHELSWELFSGWLRIPNQRRMDDEAGNILRKLDAPFIPLRKEVANLSAEERQLVAIAHIMVRKNKLILIDNPSPLLSIPYQEKLLSLIRGWQEEGIGVLYNSSNLDHLFAVSDRILALRQGQLVASSRTDETTREDIVTALIGSEPEDRSPVIWALDSYYTAQKQAEMLRHNQRLLQRDLQARDTTNRQLVDQLAEQVQALDDVNYALQDAQRRLMTEREQERKHLSREIHDQAIQDLLSINYQLEEVAINAENQDKVLEEIKDVRGNVRELVEELRRICGNLRPPTIDSLGLGAALRSYSRDWSQRTGIAVELEIDEDFGRLPEALELSIFRIVQEGLNNIWRHAKATKAIVSLKPTSPRMLLISITDDGRGFNKKVDLSALGESGHYGLLGISERVALLGGRMRFDKSKKGGVLMQIEVPHPRITKIGL